MHGIVNVCMQTVTCLGLQSPLVSPAHRASSFLNPGKTCGKNGLKIKLKNLGNVCYECCLSMHVNITLDLKLYNAYAALRVVLLCSDARTNAYTPIQLSLQKILLTLVLILISRLYIYI